MKTVRLSYRNGATDEVEVDGVGLRNGAVILSYIENGESISRIIPLDKLDECQVVVTRCD